MNVTGLEKDYAALVEGVVLRIQALELCIGTILADREFFNRAVISTCFELGVDFIMTAKTDKRIKKLLKRHKEENGREPAIFEYSFKAEGSPEFYLVKIRTCSRSYVPYSCPRNLHSASLISHSMVKYGGSMRNWSSELPRFGSTECTG